MEKPVIIGKHKLVSRETFNQRMSEHLGSSYAVYCNTNPNKPQYQSFYSQAGLNIMIGLKRDLNNCKRGHAKIYNRATIAASSIGTYIMGQTYLHRYTVLRNDGRLFYQQTQPVPRQIIAAEDYYDTACAMLRQNSSMTRDFLYSQMAKHYYMHTPMLSDLYCKGDGSNSKDECPKDAVPDSVRQQAPDTCSHDDENVSATSDEDGVTTVDSDNEAASTSGNEEDEEAPATEDEYAATTNEEEDSDVEMELDPVDLPPEEKAKLMEGNLELRKRQCGALKDFTKNMTETFEQQRAQQKHLHDGQKKIFEQQIGDQNKLFDGQLDVLKIAAGGITEQIKETDSVLKLLTPAKKKTPRHKIMKTPRKTSTTKRVRSSSNSKSPFVPSTPGLKRSLFDTVPTISASRSSQHVSSVTVSATLERNHNGQWMFKIVEVGENVLEVPTKLPFKDLSPLNKIYMDIDGNGNVCLFQDVPADGECLASCMKYYYNQRHAGNKSATEIRHSMANLLAADNYAVAFQIQEVLRGLQLLSFQDEPDDIVHRINRMHHRLSLPRIGGSEDYMDFDDCILYSLKFDTQSNIELVSDRKSGFESMSTNTILEAVYAHPEIDHQKLPELPGGTWAPMYFLHHASGSPTGSYAMSENHYGLLLPAKPEEYKNLPIYKGGGKWDLSGVPSIASILGLGGSNNEVRIPAPPSSKRRRL